MSMAGHFWTIAPNLKHRWVPLGAPPSVPWSTQVEDPQMGKVALSGKLSGNTDADTCLIVVHGLGGTTETHYAVEAACAAERSGIACLRLSLRGADHSGEDFYHAGLVADIEAAVTSTALARYERLCIVGYSMGGHVTLRYALGEIDRRVQAVAALCAPLDLELGAQAIDRARSFIYRYHVLAGLKAIYSEVARRKRVPTALKRVLAARTIREWDGLTVVPRYGFESAEQYYEAMSVGPRLGELRVPALLIQNDLDPMVPRFSYDKHLSASHPRLTTHHLRAGGHVGFPALVQLGDAPAAQLEDQVLSWLLAARA